VTNEQTSWGDFFRKAPLGPKIKVGFFGLMALGVMIGSGWSIFQLLRLQPHKVTRAPAAVAPKKVEPFTYSYELADVSISLAAKSGKTVAHGQISLTMDLPSAEAKQWMELNRAKSLDTIYGVLEQFNSEDLQNNEGKTNFKNALLKAYAERFKTYAPRELALSQISVD
jgi:flagellar basal body-associated protein FliL